MKLFRYYIRILNSDRRAFDCLASRISREAGGTYGYRLISIIRNIPDTCTYTIDLTEDEAMVLKLCIPGRYQRYCSF